jgi:DNA polymerase III delta prime subunit/DNA-binding MarR family transcriptional regulator
MSERALQTSRYSPGNLAPAVLERLFVGRSELLDDLIAKVSTSVLSRSKHHLLLVGPRGSGKTHIIALLHQRLTTDPVLAKARARFVIAYLNEEEWGVASFLDFMLVILRSLQSEHEDIASRISLVEEVFERDPDKAGDLAEDALLHVVGNKTLVLLCENLNDLFQGLGSEGQKRWRSLVQEHRFWCIVATAPALFPAVTRQTQPFYGFFTVRSLESLPLDDAIDLLRRKARLEGRHDLAVAIDTPIGRARVHAFHHIAGGNHRAYIVLSEFLTPESLEELVSPFMSMIDDLTPYYQERMRNLTSPLQRKLVGYLCRQRKPSTVRDIAKATLVQPQSAAKQLGELAKSGIVQKTPRGRESFYELSEPLMRMCIEVKDNRTGYLKAFVDLLRHWFSSRETGVLDRDPLYEQALILLNQGKPDDAIAAAERVSSLGASADSTALKLLIKIFRLGLSSIVDELAQGTVGLPVREVLVTGAWLELQQRGPSSLDAHAVTLRERLSRDDRDALLSEALLSVLRRLVRTRSSSSRHSEWADALAKMASQMPGFEVLLQLFSVGVRYAATQDDGVLLELPLELRRLLTSEVQSAS